MIDVSIIMPVRNERHSIRTAVDSALGQTLTVGFEVLAIDGASEDGTRESLDALARTDPRLRVLSNPHRLTGPALNLGLREARGTYWVRLDGHSQLPPDFVGLLLQRLTAGSCEAAGGVVKGLGQSSFGRASAAVLDSRFGIGDARHHYASVVEYVDHVSHGMYRVDRSRAIGGFDESLLRNEDYDFDYRYRRAGGRILLEPKATFWRGVRESPAQLARQFHDYGYWKYVVLRRYPRSLRLRWLVPPAMVATAIAVVPAALAARRCRFLALLGLPYLATVTAGTAAASRQVGLRLAPRAATAMVIVHWSWGFGFLRSAVAGFRRRRSIWPQPATRLTELSAPR